MKNPSGLRLKEKQMRMPKTRMRRKGCKMRKTIRVTKISKWKKSKGKRGKEVPTKSPISNRCRRETKIKRI